MKRKLSEVSDRVLSLILARPGKLSALDIALQLREPDEVYGPYQAVSRALVGLRKLGLVRDVAVRCEHCGAALTRGQRNQKLWPGEKL